MIRLGTLDTIRARLVGGIGMLALALAVIAFIATAALRSLDRIVSRELATLTRVSDLTNQLVGSLFDEIRSGEQYITDRVPSAAARFREAGRQSYAAQQGLRALPVLNESDRILVTRIGQLQADVEVWYALAHAQRDLERRGDAVVTIANAREPSEELLRLVRSLSAVQRARTEAAGRELAASSRQRRLLVWTVLASAVLLGVAAGTAVLRSTSNSLTRLEAVARRFADGDLRPVDLGAMPLELRALADALGRATVRLRSLVGSVVQEADRIAATAADLSAVSNELAASAEEVSGAMIDISGGAERQVTELEQSSGTVESMRSAASENKSTVEQVANLGRDIHQLAQRNQQDVSAAAETVLQLGELVQKSASQVERLEELSESIYSFVELTKTIASQTNLLALNAAIEAARAGASGVGFAVVADEVRVLADSSAAAAEETVERLAEVRSQIATVAATMGAGRTRVQGVETVAQGAAHALEEIVRSVAEIETAARWVQQEAERNLDAAEKVKREIQTALDAARAHAAASEQVTAATQQQGASTEEMAAQAGELSNSAERLRGFVKEFRL
jgi:methyl-accepting chemotaxis protein